MSIRVVSLLLFFSGLCALVFQAAWLREFRLIFGASTPANAAVLAIFMGGLGLGNVVLGKRTERAANPLRLYAQFEVAVSIFGALSPLLVLLVRAMYLAIGGQESLGALGATAVRLFLSALVMGPPTFFMGGTLPAAARAVTGAEEEGRGSLGWLYGLNTLGAVAGTILSTFFLLEWLGNRETIWLASAFNLANAGAIWWWSSRENQAAAAVPSLERTTAPPSRGKSDKKHREAVTLSSTPDRGTPQAATSPGLVYAAAAIVGGVFFLLELVWYRMLGAILGGTTFTFGLILAIALAGIGIGGALYPVLFRGRVPSIRDFALTCAWEALAIAIPFALGDWLALFAHVLQGMRYFGFYGQAAGWAIVVAIVVLPAALASGVQFPLLVALLGKGKRDVGWHVGQTSAWNTLGCILGSLAGGFGLLPLLSAPGAWKLASIVLIVTTLAALWIDYRSRRRAAPLLHPLLATTGAALCLSAVGPTAVWRHSAIGAGRARPPAVMNVTQNELRAWMHERRRQIAWEADGIEASVAIATGGSVAFLVNGKSDGNSVTDAATQIMFPVLGAMLHADPRESLVIGLGTGESAGWLAELPTMERVDVVELEPAIAYVAEQCKPLNHDVLNHPKVRVIYNDARELVQTTRQKYDLIASEPSNPYRSGVSSLYTADFYQQVRKRLKPGGLFVQWLQGYEIDIPTVRMVLATLRRSFEHVEIWETKPGDMVLICGVERPGYDLAQLQARVSQPVYREALRIGWRTTTVEGFLAHFVASERFVNFVVAQESAEINTDNRNLLEYRFARTVGRGADFSVAQLREDARASNLGRPPQISEGVDWEAVLDQLVAYHAALSEPPLLMPPVSGDRAKRAEAMQHYFHDNLSNISALWEQQPKPPVDVIETATLALSYAEQGDEKARPLIERLHSDNPTDAEVLRAILNHRQGKQGEAAQHVESALVAMKTDASVLPRLVDGAYVVAARIAQQDPQQGPRLFVALGQPLALSLFNERRRLTRCLLARQLNADAAALAVAMMEPHVPWNEEFLTMRRSAYEATGNPLAAKARRDLDEFRRHAGEAHLINSQ